MEQKIPEPLDKFYKAAHSGNLCNRDEILSYIQSFSKVILWGAGNLGSALGKELLKMGAQIFCYWDKKYEEIGNCNQIPVNAPFTEAGDKQNILVISCIANGSLGDVWPEKALNGKGYKNHILGMPLYEGIVCPLNKTYFNIRECTNRKACSLCNCQRYTSLLSSQIERTDALTFQLITFVISTRCTLNCKYCGQRLSLYPPNEKVDFDLKSILRDIDNFMSSVDFVGMVSVIGGEPFLHPQLSTIVKRLLDKDNFGVVNITTNGVVKISKDTLDAIKNERVKVSFSAYDTYLNDRQKELLYSNVKKVEDSGISCSVSHPLWLMPSELKDYGHSEEMMTKKKSGCPAIQMSACVKNGVFYPCTIAENMEGLHIESYASSTVNVAEGDGLRERLQDLLSRSYFDVCRYCGNTAGKEIPAGEQLAI